MIETYIAYCNHIQQQLESPLDKTVRSRPEQPEMPMLVAHTSGVVDYLD